MLTLDPPAFGDGQRLSRTGCLAAGLRLFPAAAPTRFQPRREPESRAVVSEETSLQVDWKRTRNMWLMLCTGFNINKFPGELFLIANAKAVIDR